MSINVLPPPIQVSNIKVLVCCHKADSYIRHDGIYVPIQVGAALSKVDLGFLKDNEGNPDNISNKNREYCELTALYWMWKNQSDADYVGLCHYRRYFSPKVTPQFVLDTLGNNKNDVITCRAVAHPYKNFYELCLYIGIENFLLMTDSLVKLHPDCYEAMAYTTFYSNKWIPCNMFISSRQWMDEYCKWLFPVLEDVEKRMAKSAYTRANRALGYMGEYLLGVYLRYSKPKVKQVEMSPYMEENGKLKIRNKQMTSLTRLLNTIAFNTTMAYTNFSFSVKRMLGMKNHTMMLSSAGVTGFKADGIDISTLISMTEKILHERQKQKAKILGLVKLHR